MGTRVVIASVVVFALLLFVPTATFAQAAIAGVVRDTTGAVLPGVTVEASSPALIEKVRTVTTDGEGLYKIVDLRPGSYIVTFTLTGFTPVKRQGIELSGSFTATVNAELRVGGLEETLTVSGAAPTVDVQAVAQEKVLQRDTIDEIPTGNRDFRQLGTLIPGVVPLNNANVGGVSYITDAITVHDSRSQETQLLMDGMSYHHGGGVGGVRTGILPNDGAIEEMQLQTSGGSAENAYGTIISNVIPKTGGNRFTGVATGAYGNNSMQTNNITATEAADGVKNNGLKIIYDAVGAFGGPIRQDKLWFYTAFRKQEYDQYVAGVYYNTNPLANLYTPNLSAPAYSPLGLASGNLRLTTQVTPKNKFTVFYDIQHHCECYEYKIGTRTTPPPSPEAIPYYNWIPDYMWQAKWTSTVSNRLLIEAGSTYTNFNYPTTLQAGVSQNTVGFINLNNNFDYRNIAGIYGQNENHMFNAMTTGAYVTGSHAVKVGFQFLHSSDNTTQMVSGANQYNLNVLNNVPVSLIEYATPLALSDVLKASIGVFAQDQWTIKRLTLNYGLRFDYWNSYVPAESVGPAPNVPSRNISYPEVPNVPLWKNWTPRLGASYDLFGDGKTALKGSLGKYVFGPEIIVFTRAANPLVATVTSVTRSITDGSFTPNCDLTVLAANGDCGPVNNPNFGSPHVVTQYDTNAINSNRTTNWEGSAAIQHELHPGVSVSATYFRRWYQNLEYTQNQALSPSDYNSYCITAPSNPELPNGGGYPICGLYDLSPAAVAAGKFGATSNLITVAPAQTEVYNGFDFQANARLAHGIVLSGGTSTGRTEINQCFKLGSPNDVFAGSATGVYAPYSQAYCDTKPPFQTQYKAYAVVPLPWGFRTSATLKSLPGPQITAAATYTSAQIDQLGLGRPLAGSVPTLTIDLVPPGTMYGERLTQVDWRLSKALQLWGTRRLNLNFDLFNLFNESTVLNQNNSYAVTGASSWLYPTLVVGGRLMKVSGQLNF
jgi:hypothetical protein